MPGRKRPVTPEETQAKEQRQYVLAAIGKRMQERREFLGHSQEHMIRNLKDSGLYIQRSSYSHYESGYVEMNITALVAVSRALKTTPGFLLGQDEGDLILPIEDAALPAANEWLNKIRSVIRRVSPGRARSLLQQRIMDFADGEAAFMNLLAPPSQEPPCAP